MFFPNYIMALLSSQERYTELLDTIKILTDMHKMFKGDPFLCSIVMIGDETCKVFNYIHPVIQTSTREYVCGNTVVKEYHVSIPHSGHPTVAYFDMNIYEQLSIDMYHHATRILTIIADIYTRRMICETLQVKFDV